MNKKPKVVKDIEKSAGVQCQKVGEYSHGYDDWETYLCPLPDGEALVAQRYYTHTFARHVNSVVHLSLDEVVELGKKLKGISK